MKKILSSVLLMLLLVTGMARAAEEPTFTVDAPGVVAADEMFRIVFTASGTSKARDFSGPSFEGFEVLAGPISSTSTSIQIINGKRSENRQESFTYTLLPKSVGKFTIGAASVKISGKEYRTQDVVIEVLKEQQNQNAGTSQSVSGTGSDLMMRLTLNKHKVVKGEPIIATLRLYVQNSSIGGFEDVRFPEFNGFWSQEIETPQQIEFERENLDGRIYNAALLRKYMLIPQQTGTLKIDPAELICVLQVRNSSPSRSIFDDFFDSYQTIRKRVLSPAVKVEVSPLPAGAPASFKGGVGTFRMDVSLSQQTMKAHEAGSLKVKISGTGNLNMIEAPSVVLPPDFESYDIKKNDDLSTTSGGSSGSRIFEFPFIPRSVGEFTIPSVSYTYYDVSSRKYKTLTSAPLTLEVQQGEASSATVLPGVAGKQSVKSLGEDIRFISTVTRLKQDRTLLVASVWIYVLYALVLLLFFAAGFYLKKHIVRKNDVAGTKNRKARKVARARLKLAESFLKQNLYTAFYEELHKAIDGYVSDKLMLPQAEMSRDRIREELEARGKGAHVEPLFALLDACEYARYAPAAGSEAMEKHYHEAAALISEMES